MQEKCSTIFLCWCAIDLKQSDFNQGCLAFSTGLGEDRLKLLGKDWPHHWSTLRGIRRFSCSAYCIPRMLSSPGGQAHVCPCSKERSAIILPPYWGAFYCSTSITRHNSWNQHEPISETTGTRLDKVSFCSVAKQPTYTHW